MKTPLYREKKLQKEREEREIGQGEDGVLTFNNLI